MKKYITRYHVIFLSSFVLMLLFVPHSLFALGGSGGGGSGGGCSGNSLADVKNFKCFVEFIRSIVNDLIVLIIGLAVFLFIFGLLKYVMAGGDESKVEEAKRFIIFGLIAVAVMLSVWGLVYLIVGIFFPGGITTGPQFN